MNLSILLLTVFLSGCVSVEISEKTGVEKLVFGEGGQAEKVEIYYVLEADGDIKDKNGYPTNDINATETLAYFTRASELLGIEYQQTGNIYSFLTIETPTGTKRLEWSTNSKDIPHKLKTLYQDLLIQADRSALDRESNTL